MNQFNIRQKLDTIKKKSKDRQRKCLYENCNENAIKSHVLQKNGILKEISVKNHLYQLDSNSSFEFENKGFFTIKKVGINDIYTFPGFCKNHDSNLFSPIEQANNINFEERKNLCLFSYRTLCQELRRKEIVIDIVEEYSNIISNIDLLIFLNNYKKGNIGGIKNLTYFKEEFEKEMQNDTGLFSYKVCKIPKVDICISSPLNIEDPNNPLSETVKPDGEANYPFVTSVINIFPYRNKSYVIIAQHNRYKCNWTELLFEKFQNSNEKEIFKLISGLISTRFEFWCISPKLYDVISKEKIKTLFQIWEKEVLNHSWDINYDFNLFD